RVHAAVDGRDVGTSDRSGEIDAADLSREAGVRCPDRPNDQGHALTPSCVTTARARRRTYGGSTGRGPIREELIGAPLNHTRTSPPRGSLDRPAAGGCGAWPPETSLRASPRSPPPASVVSQSRSAS